MMKNTVQHTTQLNIITLLKAKLLQFNILIQVRNSANSPGDFLISLNGTAIHSTHVIEVKSSLKVTVGNSGHEYKT
jgi:hypothetical protein